MRIFDELMKDSHIKRAVLVEFGFGDVSKKKVVDWVKKQFPLQFADIKKGIPTSKVVGFSSGESEMMTAKERSDILDKAMGHFDSMNGY